METPCRFRPHLGRIALVAMAAFLLAGCPTFAPTCVDSRDYVPEIVVAPSSSKAESVVIGRLLVGDGGAVNPVSVELSRLDEDTVVARTSVRLPPDGRFAWGLNRGHYVIARVIRYSDYAKGQYQIQASFSPHLRFDAIGTRYVGQARATLDSSLDDILPAHLFVLGTPRQGRLGVSTLAVTDELKSERSQPSAPAALHSAILKTALMQAKPVEVYHVQTKRACTEWQYIRPCILPWGCL